MRTVVVFLLPTLLASGALAKKPKDFVPPGQAGDDCAQRRAQIGRNEQRLNDMISTAAGYDEEIAELESRLADLRERKAAIQRTIERGTRVVADRRDQWKGACEKNQDCRQVEDLVDVLEERQKPQEVMLDNLKREFGDTRKETASIRAQIEPLAKEYQETKCDDLVPGQTSTATIRRCQDLFLKWNDLQAAINRNNLKLPQLRSRYKEVSVALDANEKQGREYEAYLDANCKQSKKLVDVRRGYGVRDRARALQTELDGLLQDLTSVRSVRITVD